MGANPSLEQVGGVWALEISTFLGPKWLSTDGSDAISRGPKKSRFPGPKSLPLALVRDFPASKALLTGLYKS
jgi:hypothetical protein